MILVYTGNGKGKTSACLGQVIRALGQGMNVAFGQFMKRDDEAGEQAFLRQHLGVNFLAGGAGFFRNEAERSLHRQAIEQTLNWVKDKMKHTDVLILDECLYALGSGLLSKDELKALIAASRLNNCHLILSGRGFPEDMLDQVDMVTEMAEIKHPFQQGMSAVRGLDY